VLDLRDAVGAGTFGFLQDAGIGFESVLLVRRARFRHFIVRQVDAATWSVLAEHLPTVAIVAMRAPQRIAVPA